MCDWLLERKLLYLDPHHVQPFVDFNSVHDTMDDSFHSSYPSHMDVSQLDPSIAIVCLPLYCSRNAGDFLTSVLYMNSCLTNTYNFYIASDLKDLFHNIHPERIISFILAIGLTNKLYKPGYSRCLRAKNAIKP